MASSEWHRYMASREWMVLRRQIKERAIGVCEHCRKTKGTQAHHLTYERAYNELPEDLLWVCRPCHAWFGAETDFDPRTMSMGVFHEQLELLVPS